MDSTGDRVAVVAGASRGLGLALATELALRGAIVVICARDEQELLAAARIVGERVPSARVHIRVCDVGDEAAVAGLVDDVERTIGAIEVLLAVAGIIQVGPFEAQSLDDFRASMNTMAWGPIHLVWSVLPHMRRRGRGRIGIVTSIGGVVSPPHLLPYATAKFAAVGFSDGLAAALSGTGVTATTIVPGLMRTGSHERALFAGDAAREYAWFAPAASLPGLSMDADRAARRMVTAVLRGRPLLILTPMAKAAVRVRGLMPGTTTRVMGLVNRMLPEPGAPAGPVGTIQPRLVEGREAARRLDSGLVRRLTTLGAKAARKYNARATEQKERVA